TDAATGEGAFERAIEAGTAPCAAVSELDTRSACGRARWSQGDLLDVLRLGSAAEAPRRTLSFVSHASVDERVRQWRCALAGGIVHFPEDSDTVTNDLREVMPD